MNIFENKFIPISIEWIANYIESLYFPYKEFGNLDELLKDEPKYIYPSKKYNGQLKKWVKNGDESYIIRNPKSDEVEKIKDFREFEFIRTKLLELRNLQIQFTNKDLEKPDEIILEKQIDNLYSSIFEVADDYLITKQRTIFYKRTKDYIFSKKEEERLKRNYKETDIKKYKKSKLPDKYNNYKITFKPLIDHKINSALKRDYKIFNKDNSNYRIIEFENIGRFELFKINNKEYLIEKDNDDKNLFISIYNYEFYKKWLKFLDGLIGNYNIGQFKEVKVQMLNDAKEKSINNIDSIIEDIENIFYNSLDYHNHTLYKGIKHNSNRYLVLSLLPNKLFWWKQEKESEIINAKNSLITQLQEHFLSPDMFNFMQVRDFVIFWIGKYIDTTINNDKRMFQWSYSPFIDYVLKLDDKIFNLFSDDKIALKNKIKPVKEIDNSNKPQLKTNTYPTTEKKYLKDLFATTELYNKAIKVLTKNKFISENNNTLNWIFTPTKKYTTNQTIIALMVVLEIKQYLKPKPSAVYNNIKNEFNIKIHKGNYSTSSNGFKEDYDKENTKNKSYTDLFRNIL